MNSTKVTPPIPPKKAYGVPEGLSPEEAAKFQKVQAKIGDFVLHLMQAFLRTGYYTPEHPESKRAKEGLYQLFKALFESDDELTFLVREEQEKHEIFVEGILPEAQKLSRMMMKGMGELYVPKFAKYMERKDLISLTLKSRMNQTEFGRFIDIMSEPSLVDTHHKQDKERFTKTLFSQGVLNISYVFDEELLAPEREMPWRARLTLSRMRKDLRMVPQFQRISGMGIEDLQKSLLRDSLRPVRQSDLLCEILLNSDLAAPPGVPEEFVEDEILSYLERHHLLGTSKAFLREYLRIKGLKKSDALEMKADRLANKVSLRLGKAGGKEGDPLIEEFFRLGVIGLDELTPRLKDKILLERLTDKFLGYADQFFEKLDQAKEQEHFLTVANSFIKMLPELIRRDRYPEILRIFETMKIRFHQKGMWALLAGQVLEEIGHGTIPLMLEEKFLTGKKEARTAIIPIFASLEIGAIPHLISILKTSEDQWVRKNACEALIQIGPVAAAHLLKELEAHDTSVDTTCDILRVLGAIGSQQWKAPLLKLLTRFASHEHPRLREQALHSLHHIGDEEESIFLSGLGDPDLEVQKRAVWCLGMMRSEKGVEKMVERLNKILASPSQGTEQLETQIYHAFGNSGNISVNGRTVEALLIEILRKRGIRRWWGLLEKNPLSDTALTAICEALGKIGTQESVKILNRLSRSRGGPWVPKTKEALKKIEERKNLSKAGVASS